MRGSRLPCTRAPRRFCRPSRTSRPASSSGRAEDGRRGSKSSPGPWDAVLDFTGTDRSALASRISRAPRRVTFAWVRKRFLRGLAYTEFVDSPVRDFHTADHYTHLLRSLGVESAEAREARLRPPEAARSAAARRLREAGIGRGVRHRSSRFGPAGEVLGGGAVGRSHPAPPGIGPRLPSHGRQRPERSRASG